MAVIIRVISVTNAMEIKYALKRFGTWILSNSIAVMVYISRAKVSSTTLSFRSRALNVFMAPRKYRMAASDSGRITLFASTIKKIVHFIFEGMNERSVGEL